MKSITITAEGKMVDPLVFNQVGNAKLGEIEKVMGAETLILSPDGTVSGTVTPAGGSIQPGAAQIKGDPAKTVNFTFSPPTITGMTLSALKVTVSGIDHGLNNVPLTGNFQDVKIGLTATIDQTFVGNPDKTFEMPDIGINVAYA